MPTQPPRDPWPPTPVPQQPAPTIWGQLWDWMVALWAATSPVLPPVPTPILPPPTLGRRLARLLTAPVPTLPPGHAAWIRDTLRTAWSLAVSIGLPGGVAAYLTAAHPGWQPWAVILAAMAGAGLQTLQRLYATGPAPAPRASCISVTPEVVYGPHGYPRTTP